MKKDEYVEKLSETFGHFIKSLKNPQILEFGVRHGLSTNLFLKVCENNNGHLYSVDIDDYSSKFNSNSWTFIHGSDDNFSLVEKHIPDKIDLIYIDSFHDAEHVKKIFYHYYNFLKKDGYMVIDDISWLPYSKKRERNNFNSEINNLETFYKILDIYNSNYDKFDLTFNFKSSGVAKIIKRNNENLSDIDEVLTRETTIKNIVRKILRKLKSNEKN